MDKQYMDYGYIPNNDPYFTPPERVLVGESKGDIYMLTHDGEGKSLSFMNKAFISFTYGDKKIEDFGFIATTVNNRLDRENPPNSEDYVTEYKMIHGQYYWGSHYLAREMTITLATDGVTQKQLDDFKYWFQAGEIRELILSLHPNRAIMARVEGRPEINVLPFKKLDKIFINNEWQLIEIIEYKGEAQINFVMDEPFWYAKMNVLGQLTYDEKGNTILVDKWINSNGLVIDILDNDGLRVIKEDMIPNVSMIENNNINFSNMHVLQILKPIKEHKYKLADIENDEAIGKIGAPIVNDEEDSLYPFSGAVVGPLYLTMYNILGTKITSIAHDQIKEGYEISQVTGKTQIPTYMDGELSRKNLAMNYPIGIKKGSIIQYISSKLTGKVVITQYEKEDNAYKFLFDKTIILNYNNTTFIALEDTYIKLELNVIESLWNELEDGSFSLEAFIELSLIPLGTQVNGDQLAKNLEKYYFYSGNAISYPTINFSVPIHFNNEYIDSFSNNFCLHEFQLPYNIITLESELQHELKITNPSIFDSYNKVISLLKNDELEDFPSFIQQLRNNIPHSAVRNWIIGCINIYYNNFDTEKIIVTADVKEQLLKYMPYLFVTAKDVNILIKIDEPVLIKESFQSLDKTVFTRTDNKRFPITADGQLLVENDGAFTIQVDTYTDEIHIINSSELYFQWQYSMDQKKWYLIFDDEQWLGATTQVLTCKKVNHNDFGIYLRCIVSNNSKYTGLNNIVQVIEYDDDINITIPNNRIMVDQNSTATLIWNIQGRYLHGTEYDASDYIPKIYYLPNNNTNNWIEYISNNNEHNYSGQIENGNKQLLNERITFSFTVRENEQRQLRGTKFKLIVYPYTAKLVLSPTDEEFEQFNDIEIDINRLEVANATIVLTATYNNKQLSLSNEKIIDFQGFRLNTEFNLLITDISNISSDITNTVLQISDSSGNVWIDYNDSGITKNISSNSIIFSWTLNTSWNNIDTYMRIKTTRYGEEELFLNGQHFNVYQLSAESLNSNVDNYNSSSARYSIVENNQLYATLSNILLSISHSNTILAANSLTTTYMWYYSPTLSEGEFKFETATLLKTEIDSSSRSSQYLLRAQDVTVDKKGYYACQVIFKAERPVPGLDEDQYKTFTITPNGYIYIDVIKRISLEDTTCNLSSGIYYSLLPTGPLMDTTAGINITFPYTLIFQCPIINYLPTRNYTINWYYNIGASSSNPISGGQFVNNNENWFVQYNAVIASASNLYELNRRLFYCIVIDEYGQQYESSSVIKLEYEDHKNRIVDLQVSAIALDPTITWNWPLAKIDYTKEANEFNSTFKGTVETNNISYKITSSLQNNQKVISFSGTPKTNTVPSSNINNLLDRNKAAAQTDKYPIPDVSGSGLGVKLYPASSYTGYNAEYIPVIQFSGQQYSYIDFLSSITIPENPKYIYKYKILNNNVIIQDETDLQLGVNTIKYNNAQINNADNIQILFKIYYPTRWPQNIGVGHFTENANQLPDIALQALKKAYPIYDKSKIPTLTVQLIITKLKGQVQYQRRSIKFNNILKFTRSARETYTPPTISQQCPICINCKTGEYTMLVSYNIIKWPNGILKVLNYEIDDPKSICYLSSLRYGLSYTNVESIGNAILFNNLIFSEQNLFNKLNKISTWTLTNKNLSYKLTYDGDVPLENFNVLYKNYYL